VMIDATHLKAHRTAASLLKTYGPPRLQATIGWRREQSAQTYPACRRYGRRQDGDPRIPILI